MLVGGRYREKRSIEINSSKEQVLAALHAGYEKLRISNDVIEINDTPSSLAFWKGRGKIILHMDESRPGSTLLRAEFIPRLLTFDLAQVIFLIVLGALVYFIAISPLTVYWIVAAVLVWMGILFIAPYLIFVVLLTESVIFLNAHNSNGGPILLMAWMVLLLVTHLELVYNRRQLRKKFMETLVK